MGWDEPGGLERRLFCIDRNQSSAHSPLCLKVTRQHHNRSVRRSTHSLIRCCVDRTPEENPISFLSQYQFQFQYQYQYQYQNQNQNQYLGSYEDDDQLYKQLLCGHHLYLLLSYEYYPQSRLCRHLVLVPLFASHSKSSHPKHTSTSTAAITIIIMARFGWRVPTPTPTPTDAWSSYFESWKTEDKEVPAALGIEPMILDDELHPDSVNVKFNVDFELDWDLDLDFQDTCVYAPVMSTTRLNDGRRARNTSMGVSRRCSRGRSRGDHVDHDVNRQGPAGGARNEVICRRDRERARIGHESPGYHAHQAAYEGHYGRHYGRHHEDTLGLGDPPEDLYGHAYACACVSGSHRVQHHQYKRVSAVTIISPCSLRLPHQTTSTATSSGSIIPGLAPVIIIIITGSQFLNLQYLLLDSLTPPLPPPPIPLSISSHLPT